MVVVKDKAPGWQNSFFDIMPSESKLEAAFWSFHEAHPEVYAYMVRFARQWRTRRGEKARLGISALFERVRWEFILTKIDEAPKLNNNHRAYYARLIMQKNPDLDGIFELRRQRLPSTIGPKNETLPPGDHIA